jgi:hypothetical protein
MVPGVEVFGTPGWLTPLVFRPLLAAEPVVEGIVDGVVAALGGGVAGETVGPAAGDCAAAANDDPARTAAASAAMK